MVYADYRAIDDHGDPLDDPDFRPQNRITSRSPMIHLPRSTASSMSSQTTSSGRASSIAAGSAD